MKRFENILGVLGARPVRRSMFLAILLVGAIGVCVIPLGHSQGPVAHESTATSPSTGSKSVVSENAKAPLGSDSKSLVVGGGLHGSLTPPEDAPWRHWLQDQQ
jgi:hypothetical protein